ncbi:MAG: nicotinate (nicotinamide) nucleotide adenylyltransferase [Planctomycetota bacterium]|nr:nicotinate (nicotinamide) nucleotide adenylyltransferase [Planctomycetota bacterium]
MTDLILFGGSFNPFHNAHLQMVLAAHQAFPKHSIVLIPAGSPPHKQNAKQLSFEHRFQMLHRLAKEMGPWLQCSDIEGQATSPTYTLHTIRAVQKEHPEAKLYFLIGGDSLRDLPKWYGFQSLVKEAQLLIIERPGINTESAFQELEAHLSPYEVESLRAHTIPMNPSELSSTALRKGIQEGERVSEDVPGCIYEYLKERDLLGTF